MSRLSVLRAEPDVTQAGCVGLGVQFGLAPDSKSVPTLLKKSSSDEVEPLWGTPLQELFLEVSGAVSIAGQRGDTEMNRRRLGLLFLVVAVAFAAAVPSMATKDVAKKEKKLCVTCHAKTGSEELNETGNYYKEKRTLEECRPKKTPHSGRLSFTKISPI